MILITYLIKESPELIQIIKSNAESGLFDQVCCYVQKVPKVVCPSIKFIEDPKFKAENIYKILSSYPNQMCMIANPQHLITSFTSISNFIQFCGHKTCWTFGPNIILDTSYYIDKQFINKLSQTKILDNVYQAAKFKVLDLGNYIQYTNTAPSEQTIRFTPSTSSPIILTLTDLAKLSNININCINLKRATDRRLRMYNFFDGYPNFNIIDAIDGDFIDGNNFKYPKTTKKSIYEIATNFSHLVAIKSAYDKGLDMCLIMEDDIDLSLITKWEFDLNFLITNSPSDWEILQLYTNNSNLMIKLHDIFNQTRTIWSQWNASAWSAGFYVIRRSGMEKLLNKYLVTQTNKFDLNRFDHDANFLVADFIVYADCRTYILNKPIIHDDAFNSYIHSDHVNEYHVKSKNFVTKLYEGKTISILRHDEFIDEHLVFLNGFWKGFDDKTDGVHIGLLDKILAGSKLANYKLTTNIQEANVLIESVLTNQSYAQAKTWKYKIQLSGESRIFPNQNYSLVLSSDNQKENIITFPFGFQFIHTNNLVDKLVNRSVITVIPKHFCCWIVTNGNCEIRNKMFSKLSEYKKVHSYGTYLNNMGFSLKFPYWSENYQKFMGNYKFVICFENRKFDSYITEKLINPFVSRSIPIYWGTDYVNKIFNPKSFLTLEDDTEKSFDKLIKKIIELDTNDELYLQMLNEPVISDMNELNKYSPELIAQQINMML